MREPIDDDDDVDRAYRAAVESTADVAAVRRRRGAVLQAVGHLDAVPATGADRGHAASGDRVSANVAHRVAPARWWRGVAAACVIGTSTLVVVQMQRAPEATVQTRQGSDAERSAAAVPSAPIPTPVPPQRQERSTSRTGQPSAAPGEASVAAASPPSPAAAKAGNAVADSLPPGELASRTAKATVQVPGEGLLAAVSKGDVEAVRTLLQTTDPDAERDADGRTALAIAVLRADVPLVKLLLASGADRHAVDRFGQTPASYARAGGDTTLLQTLEKP